MSDIKIKAYAEFLIRLGKLEKGECMDLVPSPGFDGFINLEK